MTTMLTANLSEEALSLALDAFRAELGPEAVIAGEDELLEFRDPFAFASWDDYTASAVLMPETVEGIQQIVRVANEHKVPLWTHAAGMNNGYGGPAPRLKGSVIVSLRKMNRVLEIDFHNRFARVEAGITNLAISAAVAPEEFFYAPDPSSQLACTLAGNLAMNSGGAHCL